MDWRDPGAYAYTEKLRPQDWAWEFLRRSPRYLEAWRKYEASGSQEDAECASDPFNLLAPLDPRQSAADVRPRWRELVDAALDALSAEEREEVRGDGLTGLWDAVLFDLTLPIEPQLDMARKEMLDSQKQFLGQEIKMPRFRTGQFVLYLQLLDAEAAGASVREMARGLLGDRAHSRRSTQQILQTARSLAANGWRRLLLARDWKGWHQPEPRR